MLTVPSVLFQTTIVYVVDHYIIKRFLHNRQNNPYMLTSTSLMFQSV